MNKSFLIGTVICLLIIILVILFLVLFGKSIQSLIWVPKLEISEKSWDFGEVKIGSDVKHTFIIKNTGSAELTVYPYSSCPDCLIVEIEKTSVPPKGATKLHAKVTETEEGPYEGFVMLESNDRKQLVQKLKIEGTFIKE
jgi:hypothetical protein